MHLHGINSRRLLKIFTFLLLIIVMVGSIISFYKWSPNTLLTDKLEEEMPQYKKKIEWMSQFLNKTRIDEMPELSKIQSLIDHYDNKINVFNFKLKSHTPTDVFEITLTSQQISDLKAKYDHEIRMIQLFETMLTRNEEKTVEMEKLLHSFADQPMSKEDDLIRLGCISAIKSLHNEIDSSQIYMAPITAMIHSIAPKIDSIYQESIAQRDKAINEIFAIPQSGFFHVLPYATIQFSYWSASLPEMLRFILPLNFDFWMLFLFLILMINIPLFIINKWLIYPWISQHFAFPDSENKKDIILISGILMGIGGCFIIAQRMVGMAMATPLNQSAQFLFAFALITLALAFRVDRRTMIYTLGLYIPAIVGNWISGALYSILIPYNSLIVLLPILGLIVALSTAIMLWKRKYPPLDTIIAYLTIFVHLLTLFFAFIGLPYIGFTLILLWFFFIAQLQMVLALTEIILRRNKEKPENRFSNNFLLQIVLPTLWIGFFYSFANRVTITYHLSNWTEYLNKPFPLPETICQFAGKDLLLVIVTFFVVRFLLRAAKESIHGIYKEAADSGVIPSFITLGSYIVWMLYVLFALVIFRVNPSSILVVLGGFSMGIGFAMKEVIENFIGGIILLIGQHVRPGDIIEFDGIMGVVKTVSFRATVVETWDGSTITLPNTRVMGKDFRNWTRNSKFIRRDILIGVSYNSDMELVRKLMIQAAQETNGLQKYPAPQALYKDFDSSSVNFILRAWMTPVLEVNATSDFREKLFRLFKEHQVSIPFPQLDVHMIPNTPPQPESLAPEHHHAPPQT